MQNTYNKPVIGMNAVDNERNRIKLSNYMAKHGITVLPEHFEVYYEEDGTKMCCLTYDHYTLAPLYPLATNQLKG